jgi:2-aminoethylphosphonate-pyruvate transaminase
MRVATRTCLLNPGPVTLSDRVRRALLRDDLCHREPEFAELQSDVRNRLARVYDNTQRDFAAVLLTGSGTAAVEAMVGSLVPHDGRALVVANGVYGERIATMLQTHRKSFDMVRSAWTEPMNVAEVEHMLEKDGRFTHAIAIHHETTTGRLNDMAALGAVCRRHNVALLLDTVSSFGGEMIDFENWNIEACAATANKCLHGVPGVSFVLARKDVFETRKSGSPCLYLDLFANYREQCKGIPMFTPAVQAMYALQEALVELDEQGGWRQRHGHYQRLWRTVRSGLREQGLEPLLDDERDCSTILSSFAMPDGVDFGDLYRELKNAGFVIYPGQQALNGTIFRVAVMGDLTNDDMLRFVSSCASVIERLTPSERLSHSLTV